MRIKNFNARFAFISILIFSAVTMLSKGADTWYVSTNGIDANSGTSWDTPLLTISNAISRAVNDGDTVLVSNGTYQIYAVLEITNGITVKSVNGAEFTIVDASNRTDVGVFRVLHPDAVLEGFTAKRGHMSNKKGTAGGVYMTAGTVRWCRIINNYGYNSGDNIGGGAVCMSGGVMHHCIIQDTQFGIYHGAIYLAGTAILRNCLVSDNKYRRGGGIYMDGSSRVENCTVVRNSQASELAGGLYRKNGTVVNTIIYFNTVTTVINENWGGTTGFNYCCSTPLPPGGHNIDGDPLLVNLDERNYRLLPGSPAIGAGTTNLTWLANNPDEVDLDGNPRVVNGSIDIGAYQYVLGGLECTFVGEPVIGIAPLEVTFTNFVVGANTAGLSYYWDFNADGTIDSFEPYPTHAYEPGLFSVTLCVSNAIGEGAYYERLDYIKSGPATNFVAATGSHTFPFDTWGTAANDVQSAVDAAVDGTLIRVADGTYNHSATIYILKGITLRSENGAEVTTLLLSGADGRRSFYLSHPDVLVDGFTLRKSTPWGGGVTINFFGTIENCKILGAKHNNQSGAVLTMSGGLVRNCTLTGGEDRHVGGFSLGGSGTIENCLIVSNKNVLTTTAQGVGGGQITSASAIMRNCVIANNQGIGFTGGLSVTAGLVENCTIVDNTVNNADVTTSGGIRLTGGAVRNSIVMFNEDTLGFGQTNWYRSGGTITYSCMTPEASGTGNLALDPQFKDRSIGNYALSLNSACINAGELRNWMVGESLDLAGKSRVVGSTVDMGAYEYQHSLGTFLTFH